MAFKTVLLIKDCRLSGSWSNLQRPGWDKAASWHLYHLLCGIETHLVLDWEMGAVSDQVATLGLGTL